ncbi:MAG: ATP-binding protein, partial [Minisyncoccales bacterium]
MEKNKKTSDYNAKDIYVLEGLEPVRRRPGMYIGSTGPEGLHHLIFEVADNSLDEATMGFATEIEISLLPGNRISVSDNGRGIPVDIHPQTKKSALETVMTYLHAGAKFGGKTYRASGGLHGVGVSVVCALSKWMRAEVSRDGEKYFQEYERGKPITKLTKMGKSDQSGTTIIFEPDPEIFKKIEFSLKKIIDHLRLQAYLIPKLKIRIKDERKTPPFIYTFYFEGGIKSLLRWLCQGEKILQENIFYGKKQVNDIQVEATFCYTEDIESEEMSFANNILTREGGTHLTGFRAALTRTIQNWGRQNKLLTDKDKIEGEDVREGLTAIISVKLPEPEFEGQTKQKLGNPEARSAVETMISDLLPDFLEKNPRDGRMIIEKCLLAARSRQAAKNAKESVLRKGLLEGLALPGKLTDCTSKNPEESELFIVEGESAGGSSRQGRDRRTQAILPLRGKILNVERVHLNRVLSSKEVKSLIIALGTAIADDFDINKLRYHKIIIMADADSVTGDMPILLFNKETQEYFLTEVEKFIENCDDTFKYQVLTYNSKTKKREQKEICETIKHPLRTPLFEIKTCCGYSIKVTSCHSIYVFENGKVITKKGSEIKKGDLLIFPKSFPRGDREYLIDLQKTILNSNYENISVKVSKDDVNQIPAMAWCELNSSFWSSFQKERELVGISRKKMGKEIQVYDKVIQQWEQKIDNVMPRFYQFQSYLEKLNIEPSSLKYDVYIPLNEIKKQELPQSAKFYFKNHTHEIRTQFKLDKDLAYLIGWFLGDGCFSPEKKSPNRFTVVLGKEKAENYIKELSRIIKEKFGAKAIIEYKKPNAIQLHFHSFEFRLILTQLGLLGKKAEEKFIPDIFFNVKKEIQEGLLQGLLQSDGFITVWQKKNNIRKAIYGWRLASQKLIEGTLTIFRQWGIFPSYSVSQGKDHLRKDGKIIRSNFKFYDLAISTVDYLLQTKNVWEGHKDAQKLENYFKKVNYKKAVGKNIQPISQDFVGLPVKEVKEIKNPEDKFIYDFSVVGDQNFIAGTGGILCHNTDGNHIRTLLLTLFYRYFKPIIEKGYLYIAQPPLYKIQCGKKVEYAYTDEEKEEVLKKIGNQPVSIQRYKGLGEMNAEELWETTMEPEKRILRQVTIEDAEEADRVFDILMG